VATKHRDTVQDAQCNAIRSCEPSISSRLHQSTALPPHHGQWRRQEPRESRGLTRRTAAWIAVMNPATTISAGAAGVASTWVANQASAPPLHAELAALRDELQALEPRVGDLVERARHAA
jgi:hypothetical protein